MKKLKLLVLGLLVFSLSATLRIDSSHAQEETPCINCSDEDEPECQRIHQGNKVHIFYGVASPCI